MTVNVRVVSRLDGRASKRDRDNEFKKMLSVFRKGVTDSGVMNLYKEKQEYESKGEKRRRKMKESKLNRNKDT